LGIYSVLSLISSEETLLNFSLSCVSLM